jgi:CheY-like chemotaxis protein
MMKPPSIKTILYMDDDADDVEMLQQALNTIGTPYQLLIAPDGEQGLQLLARLKQDGQLPRLIVLDINMPGMDGKLTFVAIKKDPELATIPIVVFSTSNSPLDKLFFQRANVEYITKPISFPHLVSVAKKLLAYVED